MGKLHTKLLMATMGIVPGLVLAVVLVATLLLQSGWTDPTRANMVQSELVNLDRLTALKTEFAGRVLATRRLRRQPCPPPCCYRATDQFFKRVNAAVKQMCSIGSRAASDQLPGGVSHQPNGAFDDAESQPEWDADAGGAYGTSGWWLCNGAQAPPGSSCDNGGLGVSSSQLSTPNGLHVDAGFVAQPHMKALASGDMRIGSGGLWGMGFEGDGTFSMYPFRPRERYRTLEISCSFPGYTGSLPKVGYDPRCRPWYTTARLSTEPEFSSPYIFAGSQNLGITAALSFFNTTAEPPPHTTASTREGVCFMDIDFTTVSASVKSRVGTGGYGWITDTQGNIVAHPEVDLADPPPNTSILQVDLADASEGERRAFARDVLPGLQSLSRGRAQYFKGGERWFISWGNVSVAQYSVSVTVPAADVEASFKTTEALITTFVSSLVLVVTFTLLLVLLCVVAAASRLIASVVGPVQELRKLAADIEAGRLRTNSPLLKSGSQHSTREVTVLAQLLRQLFMVIRVSNSNLLAGDMQFAKAMLREALELFTRLQHQYAIGVCYTNLGAAFMHEQDYRSAITNYRLAVRNSEYLIEVHLGEVSSPDPDEGTLVPPPPGQTGVVAPTVYPPAEDTPGSQLTSGQLATTTAAATAAAKFLRSSTSMSSATERQAIAPITAQQGDEKHAKLLQQLASRQQNLAKAYLARARRVLDATLVKQLGGYVEARPSGTLSVSSSGTLVSEHDPLEASASDCKRALNLLESAGKHLTAAIPALTSSQHVADAQACVTEMYSDAALAVAQHPQFSRRVASLAQATQDSFECFEAATTEAHFVMAQEYAHLRVRLHRRVLAAQGASLATQGHTNSALQKLASALTTGSVCSPYVDYRVKWLMASLLLQEGQLEAARAVAASAGAHTNGAGDFLFLLDYSGSMGKAETGPTAMDALLEMFERYVLPIDRVGFITFARRPVLRFEPCVKGEGRAAGKVRAIIDSFRSPKGSSALYDALVSAIQLLHEQAAAHIPGTRGGFSAHRTIVAFTDGRDTASKHSANDVVKLLQGNPDPPMKLAGGALDITLHIVLVGQLAGSRRTLRRMVDASSGGRLLQHGVSPRDEVDLAFNCVSMAAADVTLEAV